MVSGELPLTSFFARKNSEKPTRKRKADASGSTSQLDTATTPASSSSKGKGTVKRQKIVKTEVESEAPSSSQALRFGRASTSTSVARNNKSRKPDRHDTSALGAQEETDVIDLTLSPQRPPRPKPSRSSATRTTATRIPLGAMSPLPPSSLPPPSTVGRSSASPPTSPVLVHLKHAPSRPRFKKPALPTGPDVDNRPQGQFDWDEIIPSSQTQILTLSPIRRANAISNSAREEEGEPESASVMDDDEEDMVIPSSQTQLLLLSPERTRHERRSMSKSSQLSQLGRVPSSQIEYEDEEFEPRGWLSTSATQDPGTIPSSQPASDALQLRRDPGGSRCAAPNLGREDDHDALDDSAVLQSSPIGSLSYSDEGLSNFTWTPSQNPYGDRPYGHTQGENKSTTSAGLKDSLTDKDTGHLISNKLSASPLGATRRAPCTTSSHPSIPESYTSHPQEGPSQNCRRGSIHQYEDAHTPRKSGPAQSQRTSKPKARKALSRDDDSVTESESDDELPPRPPAASKSSVTPIPANADASPAQIPSQPTGANHSLQDKEVPEPAPAEESDDEIDWERGENSFVFGSSFVDFSCESLPDIAKEFRDMFD